MAEVINLLLISIGKLEVNGFLSFVLYSKFEENMLFRLYLEFRSFVVGET